MRTRCVLPMLLLATLLPLFGGCATHEARQKCAANGCPDDARITSELTAKLRANAALPSWDIQVQTLDGTVYLYGLVATGLERNIVEDTARAIPGVTKVVNSISVRSGTH